ncbi:MAG: alkaline phosphatase D family protein, partial [Pseudomonadales bacterium]|nr:alkaline phosphatase D family protein [Pseudomonadales bacterium]
PEPGSMPREGIVSPADLGFPVRTNLPFAHGVASGDPLSDSVILWTRIALLAYPTDEIAGRWRVAADSAMEQIIIEGDFTTSSGQDWTVKVDAKGLQPYQIYYYQFYYDGAESCVGRTRTAPEQWQSQPHIRFAVCACSSYYSGYMNGYGRIADRKDLDFVIHCGDYIYDFPDSDEYFRVPGGIDDGEINPDFRSPRSLLELRRRYALYRSDPNLFRAHQQHPWLIIWDNHDIGGREQLTDQESYQAFWEWTPSRQPDPEDIYRRHTSISYGNLADIIFTDRHYPRWNSAEQHINQEYLGLSQNQFLREALSNSQQRGAPWRVLINQAFIGQFYLINPPASGDWVFELLFPDYQDGIILNDKQWDGAQSERTALLNYLRDAQISNNLFVTGDMHMNWGSDVAVDPGSPANYNRHTGMGSVGIEFAPSSISRGGADENIRGLLGGSENPLSGVLALAGSAIASTALVNSNPNAQYMEWTHHGYGIVDLQSDKAIMEYWWTPILSEKNSERLGAQLISWSGSNHLERISMPVATQRLSQNDQDLAYEIHETLLHQII